MTIQTNADADLRIDPRHRAAMETELERDGRHQDIEEEGKRNARNRVRKVEVLVPGADQPIMVDGQAFDGAVPEFALDEPDLDETVTTLRAQHVVRYVHKAWWPFRAKDAKFGLYPVMGPKAWEAIFDHGQYCLRCLNRHAEAHPAECEHCGLTEAYRNRVIEMMELLKEMSEAPGPNRAQRRAMQKQERRTRSGIVLPGGVR